MLESGANGFCWSVLVTPEVEPLPLRLLAAVHEKSPRFSPSNVDRALPSS